MLPLLSPQAAQSCSNTRAVIMLSDLFAAPQSCCGKWEACRQPCQIIEGIPRWQWCFLIEDLMLLCIQEADVELSTIGKDSRAWARIWAYWSVRIAELRDGAFRCSGGIGHQGRMSRQLSPGVLYIWFAKEDVLIFHRGVRIPIVLSAEPNAIQSRSGFLRWGNGHWISNAENFIFLLKGGLEEEIEACVPRGGRADIVSLTNSLCDSSFQGLNS